MNLVGVLIAGAVVSSSITARVVIVVVTTAILAWAILFSKRDDTDDTNGIGATRPVGERSDFAVRP